jgi:hypothetical protein
MSSEEIQHLYELVDRVGDTDKVRDQVLEGICRLEDALKKELYWAEYYRDFKKDRPRDEEVDLFGTVTTVGSIVDCWEEKIDKIKWKLHVVRSILLSLALPTNYETNPEDHVRHALEVVEDLLYENALRENLIASYGERTTASRSSTQQAERGDVDQTPSQTRSSDAQDSAPQADDSPVEMMATLMRPPEAQKGRAKPEP